MSPDRRARQWPASVLLLLAIPIEAGKKRNDGKMIHPSDARGSLPVKFLIDAAPRQRRPPSPFAFFPDANRSKANWAQLAGERAQNVATPYVPQKRYVDAATALRPMWSGRWGHAVVVVNQTSPRNDRTEEENSERAKGERPVVVLLGGDDYETDKNEDLLDGETDGGAIAGRLRNDVWVSEPSLGSQSGWALETRHLRKPGASTGDVVRSAMKWRETNPGREPPATRPSSSGPRASCPTTYDDWISCQDVFRTDDALPDFGSRCRDPDPKCYEDIRAPGCRPEAVWKRDNMWSPRRGHGALVANDAIYVVGGRARRYSRFDDDRLVRGARDERFETVRDHPTAREEVVLTNDVWISQDGLGREWTLVTPGCRDPQEDVLLRTEVWSRDENDPSLPRNVGSPGAECATSTDCYGEAECRALAQSSRKVCVCPMFSFREHHAVAVQHRYFTDPKDNATFTEDYMYVVGGFTNVRKSFCSDRACGSTNSYRLALDDAWVSNDGRSWTQFKPAFESSSRGGFRGRGAHAALLVHSNPFADVSEPDRLWLFGGETAAPRVETVDRLNDVWSVDLSIEPCCKANGDCGSPSHPLRTDDVGRCLPGPSDWVENRARADWSGRSGHVAIYEPPSSQSDFHRQIYVAGGRGANGEVLSDVWTWDMMEGAEWTKDFHERQWYRQVENGKVRFGPPSDEDAHAGTSPRGTPYRSYLTAESDLSNLKRASLPRPDADGAIRLSLASDEPLLSDDDVRRLNEMNIRTIRDLARIDLYPLLKLRGFDYPGERKRTGVPNICYLRALAIGFLDKCQVKKRDGHVASLMPKRRLGQKAPVSTNSTNCVTTRGSKKCNIKGWDGCSHLVGQATVDVDGLGDVRVPQPVRDTTRDLEEMNCRQTPGARYMSAGVFADNKVMIMGGRGSELETLYRDVWARDDTFPQATISTKPETGTPDSTFMFSSNEAGAYVFEYKIVDSTERLDVTPWISTTSERGADVSWLDHKKGGPGEGWYILYSRAIDPSGNRDFRFYTGVNVHAWYYVPPLPWIVIISCAVSFMVLALAGYFEYRRRKKKAALERYAIRRMRRKFKLHAMSEGGKRDWRDYYLQRRDGGESRERQRRNSRHHAPMDDTDDLSDKGERRRRDRKSDKDRKTKRARDQRDENEGDGRRRRRRRTGSSRKAGVRDDENDTRGSKARHHRGKMHSREEERRRKRRLRRKSRERKKYK